jgi:hypothetical protein
MRRDENGIAVPHTESPLPWSASGHDEWAWVKTKTGNGNHETGVCEPYFRADADYIAHAANYHHRLADIVRRFLVHSNRMAGRGEPITDIFDDAANLFDEMTNNPIPPVSG